MSPDLFGIEQVKPKPLSLSLYADEIKHHVNTAGEQWFYIGILLIPEEKKDIALKKLNKGRLQSHYSRELHFSKLSNYSYAHANNEKTILANHWIDILIDDATDNCFYFNILGINYSKINIKIFGEDKRVLFQNIYNRFFRTVIKSSLNYFFSGREVIIENIFHDQENNLAKHIYFDWHCINKLNEELENVSFKNGHIVFIDSDHNKETVFKEESHFIQLIDLILGSVRLCLDATCTKDGCCEVAEKMKPLLSRMMNNPGNKKSSYGYYRKYSISFFPSVSLNSAELIDPTKRIISKIYNSRRLLLNSDDQLELFQ